MKYFYTVLLNDPGNRRQNTKETNLITNARNYQCHLWIGLFMRNDNAKSEY